MFEMLYPFMTLDDGTEIVHSETLPDGRVKVYIEKPDEKDCFHHATCYLPDYEWQDIFGGESFLAVENISHFLYNLHGMARVNASIRQGSGKMDCDGVQDIWAEDL